MGLFDQYDASRYATLAGSVAGVASNPLHLSNLCPVLDEGLGGLSLDRSILEPWLGYLLESMVTLGIADPRKAAYRPGVVARDYYGSDRLGWLILLANGCDDASEFVPGGTCLAPDAARVRLLHDEVILPWVQSGGKEKSMKNPEVLSARMELVPVQVA